MSSLIGIIQKTIELSSDIIVTPRVMQLSGIFDISIESFSTTKLQVDLNLPSDWAVGVIVGASGSGKTTVARSIFNDYFFCSPDWDQNKSILDQFPTSMPIKDITEILSSVGFGTVPNWMRPFKNLSNGEQFRVNVAYALSTMPICVLDEFTSVVDRTVAKIASAAIQKTVRKRKQKLVAVTCHYDVLDWLEPDWVYEPSTNSFYSGRYLYQRSKINLIVKRVHTSAWKIFQRYHYLSANHHLSAKMFVAFWNDIPVAMCSVLPTKHRIKNLYRVHRPVCLPDYQGVGIGLALLNEVAKHYKTIGRITIATISPSLLRTLAKNANWLCIKKPSLNHRDTDINHKAAVDRLTATFEYVGESAASKISNQFLKE